MSGGEQRVVILYANPLLGEGLGRIVAADRALRVELVHVDDAAAAERALADPPDVVILERGLPQRAVDLLRLVPSALFIDVGLDAGPSWTYSREELSPEPEDLLSVIRRRPAHAAADTVAAGAVADTVAAGTVADREPALALPRAAGGRI